MRFHVTEMLRDIQDFFEKFDKTKDREEKKVLIIEVE